MSQYGHVRGVWVEPTVQTWVRTDAAASATAIEVSYAGEFAASGVLDVAGTRLAYTGITWGEGPDDADTFTLATPLAAAVATDDPVSPVVADQIGTDWLAEVVTEDGDTLMVPVPFAMRPMWPEGVYEELVPCEYADDASSLLNAPGRTPVISGDHIADGTVPSSKLTADAVSGFINGRFEEVASEEFGGSRFPGWIRSWPLDEYDLSRLVVMDGGDQIAGSASLGIELDAGATYRMVTPWPTYPVSPNTMIEVSALVKANRSVTGSPLVELIVQTSDGTVDPDGIGGGITWQTATSVSSLGTTAELLVGRVSVPAGHTAMKMAVKVSAAADALAWTAIIDETTWTRVDNGMTPHAALVQSAAQTIADAPAWTTLTNWATESIQGNTADATKITVGLAGRYSLNAQAVFAVNGTGQRFVKILVNSTTVAYNNVAGQAAGDTPVACSRQISLDAGDEISVQVRQTSGGDLDVIITGPAPPTLTIDRLGA